MIEPTLNASDVPAPPLNSMQLAQMLEQQRLAELQACIAEVAEVLDRRGVLLGATAQLTEDGRIMASPSFRFKEQARGR